VRGRWGRGGKGGERGEVRRGGREGKAEERSDRKKGKGCGQIRPLHQKFMDPPLCCSVKADRSNRASRHILGPHHTHSF